MGKMINHIGFDFVALRILHIRIRAQIEPSVQYQAGCVENSKSIQGIFRCGRIDLFTKCFGDEKTPYAATADVQPRTGPVCSTLKTAAIVLKVEPLPTPVAVKRMMNKTKNGQKYCSGVTDL